MNECGLNLFFSIIIPARNAQSTIGLCLSNVFNQKFDQDQFEVIVVDNASIDNTEEISKQFPVKLVSCPETGAAYARNLGAKNAKGRYIFFLDADSILENGSLSKYFEIITKLPAFYRTFQLSILPCFYEKDLEKTITENKAQKLHENSIDSFNSIFSKKSLPSIDSAALIIEKELFLKTEGFNEEFERFEDRLYGINLLRRGELIHPILDKKVTNLYNLRSFKSTFDMYRKEIKYQYLVEKSLGINFNFARYMKILKGSLNIKNLKNTKFLSSANPLLKSGLCFIFLVFYDLVFLFTQMPSKKILAEGHCREFNLKEKRYKFHFDKYLCFYNGQRQFKFIDTNNNASFKASYAVSELLISLIYGGISFVDSIENISRELGEDKGEVETQLYLFFKIAINKGILTYETR